MEQNQAKIWKVATEAHPHYVYQLEGGKSPFVAKDIVTTSESDPAADSTIFVVNEIFPGGIVSVHRQILEPVGKVLRKIGTVEQLIPEEQKTAAETREAEVRQMFHDLFINTPWSGTIEERLLDGYLYTLTSEDMTLAPDQRSKNRAINSRQVMVQTGKAGVMTLVEQGKKRGQTEAEISKTIWIEMVVEKVRVYVNIKNLKITDEKDSIKKDTGEPEENTSQEQPGETEA